MIIKILILLTATILFSCGEQTNKHASLDISFNAELWVDETEVYLPVTAQWTNRVELADLNGDDMQDLLFANGGNYAEPGEPEFSRIFINQGESKRFKEITHDVFAEAKYLSRVIKVRDINNDLIPDIIVGTTYQTQSQLYIGLGNGEFKNVTTTQFPQINASIGDLEFGDVDADGDLDIVLADWGAGSNMNNSGGRTMLWLNDGAGNFSDVTESQMPELLIQFSWDLEFFDFDNDFDLDIAVSCKRCGTSRIYVNDGKGMFKDKRLLPAYTNNYDFEIMDINNDGYLDLVTINDGEIVAAESDSRREHIFLNDKGEKFADATHELWPDSENIGKDDNNIVFLDYDSDGDADFLISSLTGEERLLVNNGLGKFKLIQPVLKGSATPSTLSIALGDVNNDNKMDIVMGQGEGETGIEERIFIGKNINPDTAPPIISHFQITEGKENQSTIINARIHDNKSPNMPQDWHSVVLLLDEQSAPISMNWYGENLWYASFPRDFDQKNITICATDASENKACLQVK